MLADATAADAVFVAKCLLILLSAVEMIRLKAFCKAKADPVTLVSRLEYVVDAMRTYQAYCRPRP